MNLRNGHVQELRENELDETRNERQLNVPHRPVINAPKAEKRGCLCNLVAKYRGKSLNDKLLTTPSLLHSLFGLILRFRKNQNGLTVDVEAIFLQMQVHPEEC